MSLIYVKEMNSCGKTLVEGLMNEDRYTELYFKESLDYLKQKGVFSDAIGQGRYFFSRIVPKFDCPLCFAKNSMSISSEIRENIVVSFHLCDKCDKMLKSERPLKILLGGK